MKNNEFSSNFWNDGCSSRGACSLVPSIAALQELLLYLIKQVSYYILELDKLNLNNDNLIKGVIKSVSSLVLINELNEKNLYSLILKNYYALKNAKETYCKVSAERNMRINMLEYSVNYNENTPVPSAISEGSMLLKINYKENNIVIRNHIDILINVIKSVCSNISKLYNYNICDKFNIHTIFQAINYLNNHKVDLFKLKEFIKNMAKKDFALSLQLADELQAHFGKVSEVSLSHSSRPGKAILVSGTNFFDLYSILELAKEHNIDVYTHSELLIAHSLEKFREFENLVGHYGDSTENCIVDFGTFPGAILLTDNSQNNTEFLYRGKIFSNDYNIPQGVIKIENGDYSFLIESALESKGFVKGQTRADTILGFNEENSIKIMADVTERLVNSEIKQLYIIIGSSFSESQKEYYNMLFKNLRDDEFVLSFSYGKNSNNVLVINLGNYYSLIIKFLKNVLNDRIKNDHITIIFNSCSVTMISAMILLKEFGVKNIYVSQCSPRQINPSVLETFAQQYGLKHTSNAVLDIENMRKNI